jgi:hypothetical protein
VSFDTPWQETYPRLARALAPEYQLLPKERIEPVVRSAFGETATLADAEGIFDDIGHAFTSAARAVAPVVSRALPGMMSGAMAGAPLGPWGMLAGALAGGASSALGGGAAPGRPGPMPGGFPGGGGAASALVPFGRSGGSGGALAQLLGVLASPTTQQALSSMLLGGAGAKTVPTSSGGPVPVAAITNLLGLLANKASMEWEAETPFSGEDYVGEGLDAANPEVRGAWLYPRLAPVELVSTPATQLPESDEAWLDEMYDLAEAEFYAAEYGAF